MDTREATIQRMTKEIGELREALEGMQQQVRVRDDKIREQQQVIATGYKDAVGSREQRIAELMHENNALVKQAEQAWSDLRAREDHVNDLNVQITRLAHPELFNEDGSRK